VPCGGVEPRQFIVHHYINVKDSSTVNTIPNSVYMGAN
jgi:hypothetical protein